MISNRWVASHGAKLIRCDDADDMELWRMRIDKVGCWEGVGEVVGRL
jgi:hypothetical protein